MSITLNSKVYDFAGFDAQSLSNYKYTAGGIPTGFGRLTAKVDDGGISANTKVRWKLKVPVVATEDSECACVGGVLREYIVDIVITVPPGSLSAERTDLEAQLGDLVASSQFATSITSLTQPSS